MRHFKIEWDKDYGIDHRRGWTATVDGIVVVELTTLIRACRFALRFVLRGTR